MRIVTTQAAGLGATVRAWREELAKLAGVSVDYIVRLEQGRATTPSAQVTSSLARALQLTSGERDHLFRLARLVRRRTTRSVTTYRQACSGSLPGSAGRRDGQRAPGRPQIVEHPSAGSVTVDCDVLTDGDTELKIVILTAAPGTEDETRLHLAAVAAGKRR
jgi:transcriptional regulator with XRE-family HTH domain